MSKCNASSHSTYNVAYHIVFCTKYRYNLLRYQAAERLKALLRQDASYLGIVVQTMEVMPDHVHLFIIARPAMPLPQIICRLKGHSSYFMRKGFAYLRKYPSLWTRSYFVGTVGHISEKTVVNYIENQKKSILSPFISRLKPGRIPRLSLKQTRYEKNNHHRLRPDVCRRRQSHLGNG